MLLCAFCALRMQGIKDAYIYMVVYTKQKLLIKEGSETDPKLKPSSQTMLKSIWLFEFSIC